MKVKCENCGFEYDLGENRPYLLSTPHPSNQYWPNTLLLFWVHPCCGKTLAHTECAAAFGEKESNRDENLINAKVAQEEFNVLPQEKQTIDNARTIVRQHHGRFVFDQWLDCAAEE